jgi:hypothetical protein
LITTELILPASGESRRSIGKERPVTLTRLNHRTPPAWLLVVANDADSLGGKIDEGPYARWHMPARRVKRRDRRSEGFKFGKEPHKATSLHMRLGNKRQCLDDSKPRDGGLDAQEVRIPREQYIVDYDRSSDDDLYQALSAPPVEELERSYSLEEVRFNHELRQRMRRVDPKRNFVRRVRTPSMLDAHVATIEGWLAAEPQLTALAIVGRLSEVCPA